ncbi:acyl-CoA dehydrogenase family protein [Dietzia timorensis]|uniref:Acyl-CoA dehydrogenase n=2 Tax=Dietzia timorensis TaxID=499555 RepID=A0A173LQI3_9ACTN|nr:acyl-CoA dehydrogenase family protein [Dietzia timorensis]ANI93851.1 Acyl-CoA dehydrogenase [Dietzia timorensis]
MTGEFSTTAPEFRRELREFFAELMTPERREAFAATTGEYGHGSAYRDVVAELGRAGLLALGWPEKFGGQDRPLADQLIFADEAAIAGVPVPFLTVNSVAPTIMAFGTDAQKDYFLPRIARGELHFAIGYSEPGAGTDLAALRTRAVKTTNDVGEAVYRISGQKMWTSLIAYADWVWLAVRTDPDAPRHKGISLIAVPTNAPGFSWTPVRTMAGPDTSATFYDDVEVPASNLIGEENGGWALITNQLNHERVSLTTAGALQASLRQVLDWATSTTCAEVGIGGSGTVAEQPWVQTHLARVHAMAEYLALRNLEIVFADDDSGVGRVTASATKVFGTEAACEAYRLLMEVLGPAGYQRAGSPAAVLGGRIERLHRSALILTFGGGTNEVQRDIIAMAGLGLPPAPRVAPARQK